MSVVRPILGTKLAPPPTRRAALVLRPILLERLDQIYVHSVCLITAPAGYGKTTTLSQWYEAIDRSKINCAWLGLDESDRDPAQFLTHLMATIERANSALAGQIKRTINIGIDVDLDAMAIALANACNENAEPIILIFDDFHIINSQRIFDFMNFLANARCASLHLVISTRDRPKLKLGKLRAIGDVLEIGLEDLQFDKEDARQLLSNGGIAQVSDDEIAALVERTEGWVAGLKLATIYLSNQPEPSRLPYLVSGADRVLQDFLRDEVLARMPTDHVDFVMRTSVLNQFNTDLCNQLTNRTDSADVIEDLEARQLFIYPLAGDAGWYRYHQLFADLLQAMMAQRDANQVDALHLKAAHWFRTHKMPLPALQHALSSHDVTTSVEILDWAARDLVNTGLGSTLLHYSYQIPIELLADYPNLQLERVYANTLVWQFSEAERILREVRNGLMNPGRTAIWRERGMDLDRLQKKLVYCEVQLALLRDDMPRAVTLCQQWLKMEGTCSDFEQAVNETSLIYAQREQFDYSNVLLSGPIRDIFVARGIRWGTVWHDCIIGATFAATGDLARAESVYRTALRTAEEVVGHGSPTAAIAALHLAEVLYERNEVDTANQLLDAHLAMATRTGLVDQLIAGYVTRVRIIALQSPKEAYKVLDEGHEIAISRNFDRLDAFLLAERIRLLALNGAVGEAKQVAVVNNLSGPLENYEPARGATTRDAALALCAAVIAVLDNDVNGASKLLRRWSRFLEDRKSFRLFTRVSTVLAHIQLLQGDTKAALRSLRTALLVGHRGGAIRPFTDSNPAVRAFLLQSEILVNDPDENLASYAQLVLASLGAPLEQRAKNSAVTENNALIDALNAREMEILTMVATGMMNSQIADEVGLTLGTVKWYLQQIYMKLGVNRRSEAVFKARKFGLIRS
jgi:LuxR family transcriptional regulator, maltose regulon positive regulatory protein